MSPGIWEQKELKGFRLKLKGFNSLCRPIEQARLSAQRWRLGWTPKSPLGTSRKQALICLSIAESFTATTNGESQFRSDPPAASEYQLLNSFV
jgi:hypothetical protein